MKKLAFVLVLCAVANCACTEDATVSEVCTPDSKRCLGTEVQICRVHDNTTRWERMTSEDEDYGKCECINNEIRCEKCRKDQHFFADKCEDDDPTHCGSHANDCTKLNGWKTGLCAEKTCFAETCTTGYHLESQFDENNTEKTICTEDTHDACGSINTKCAPDKICT